MFTFFTPLEFAGNLKLFILKNTWNLAGNSSNLISDLEFARNLGFEGRFEICLHFYGRYSREIRICLLSKILHFGGKFKFIQNVNLQNFRIMEKFDMLTFLTIKICQKK